MGGGDPRADHPLSSESPVPAVVNRRGGTISVSNRARVGVRSSFRISVDFGDGGQEQWRQRRQLQGIPTETGHVT